MPGTLGAGDIITFSMRSRHHHHGRRASPWWESSMGGKPYGLRFSPNRACLSFTVNCDVQSLREGAADFTKLAEEDVAAVAARIGRPKQARLKMCICCGFAGKTTDEGVRRDSRGCSCHFCIWSYSEEIGSPSATSAALEPFHRVPDLLTTFFIVVSSARLSSLGSLLGVIRSIALLKP